MMILAQTKFSPIFIFMLVFFCISPFSAPAQAGDESVLPANLRSDIQKQMEAGCHLGVSEAIIANIFQKENANRKNIPMADFREKFLGSREWTDIISPMIHPLCSCMLAKPLTDLDAIKNEGDLAPFLKTMLDFTGQMKSNPELMEKCTESATTQNSSYRRRAIFSDVVVATNAAKICVEICGQERRTNDNWQISGCGGGSNGVPVDINNPATSVVASVKTADNGVITATAGTLHGLNGETFILTPTFKDGRTFWRTGGTCLTSKPPLCRALPGEE
jgi:type IV pilus assembly protein PilA